MARLSIKSRFLASDKGDDYASIAWHSPIVFKYWPLTTLAILGSLFLYTNSFRYKASSVQREAEASDPVPAAAEVMDGMMTKTCEGKKKRG